MIVRLAKGVAIAALSLWACSSPPVGTLRVASRAGISSLDPQGDPDYFSHAVLRNAYQTLVEFHPDHGYRPCLATSWSNLSETTWRFDLRRDVRFHDKRPFGADDVRHTVERAIASDTPVRYRLPYVTGVSTRGEHAIEIETRRPAPLLLNYLARMLVVPRGSGSWLAERAIGTGPYRVATFAPGGQLTLEASDTYWGNPPLWRRAIFLLQPEGRTRVELLLAGSADVVEAPPGDTHGRIQRSGIARLVSRPGLDVASLSMNVESGASNPLARPGLRRALAWALDRERLVKEGMDDRAQPVWQLAPRIVFGHDAGQAPPEPDLARARAELHAAGLAPGIRVPFSFTERDQALAGAVVAQAAEVGIVLDPVQVSWEQLRRRHEARRPEVSLFRYLYPNLDVSDALHDLHTRDQEFGVGNVSGYSDPELDRQIEAAAFEIDPVARIRLLQRAMETARDAYVVVPLCSVAEVLAVSRQVTFLGSLPHVFNADDFAPAEP